MKALVAVALALATSCGGDDARAPSTASTPSAPAGERGGASATAAAPVRDLCGSPDEARLRALHPELPACFSRRYVFLEARVAGHDLLVLAHDADPCCTDVPSPATDAGAHVFVDGAPRPSHDPIALGAAPADADEALAWLVAELLRLHVTDPRVDAAGAERLRAAWPAARAAIDAHAPGLRAEGATFRLRALAEAREVERGIDCRSLSVWEAELDASGVRARRAAFYSAGRAMGAPCPGDPLP
ncbi:MAG: hypothetical protein KF729_09270 [Sandaracinaceae bacterium]|nr:hypothetical protein [Sandaracinaceae bacterium]